jgi:flavin reductase (DIM6/NTAB) family NADH-FMN oxidoreductase RutF
MDFDFTQLDATGRYKLLTGLVVPRPIAWVTTLNLDNSVNAAPFSFFNAMGSDPPLVALSIGNHPDRPKDTATNIERTGQFVVNLVNESLASAMNLTAAEFPPGISEVTAAGLQTTPSLHIAPPRLADVPGGLECTLHSVINIGNNRIILGEVLAAFVQDSLVVDTSRQLVTDKLGLIGRMGGRGGYTTTKDLFEMPRVLAK